MQLLTWREQVAMTGANPPPVPQRNSHSLSSASRLQRGVGTRNIGGGARGTEGDGHEEQRGRGTRNRGGGRRGRGGKG